LSVGGDMKRWVKAKTQGKLTSRQRKKKQGKLGATETQGKLTS